MTTLSLNLFYQSVRTKSVLGMTLDKSSWLSNQLLFCVSPFKVLQKMTKILKSFAELTRVIIQSDLTLV